MATTLLLSGCVESEQPLLTNAQPINGAQFGLHIYEKLPEVKSPAFHTVDYAWKDGKYVRASGLSRDLQNLVVQPMGQSDVIIQGAGDNGKLFNYWLGRKLVEGVYLVFPVNKSDSDPAVRAAVCVKDQSEGICLIKTYNQLIQLYSSCDRVKAGTRPRSLSSCRNDKGNQNFDVVTDLWISQMDLEKQVTLIAAAKRGQPGLATQVSLFEAVRLWTDDDGVSLAIDEGSDRLSEAEIQRIAHSEGYKERLLAYDERR